MVFAGGGDPSLSGREYPYQYHPGSQAGTNYSFRAVEELADQLVARGLKRIDGDIVGDDRRYVWEPHGEGWSSGDALWEYGAAVSALILNDNSFAVTIRPSVHTGDLAHIMLSPSLEYFSIDNRVRTEAGGARKLAFGRSANGRQLHIVGVIPAGDAGMTELLAVDDPAVYAAEVLRDTLLRRGIAVQGRAVARHRFSDDATDSPEATALSFVLAEKTSPPLSEILRVVDKVSQNLHAEVMLREVGLVTGHSGSREGGLAEMQEFLTSAGISKDAYRFRVRQSRQHGSVRGAAGNRCSYRDRLAFTENYSSSASTSARPVSASTWSVIGNHRLKRGAPFWTTTSDNLSPSISSPCQPSVSRFCTCSWCWPMSGGDRPGTSLTL